MLKETNQYRLEYVVYKLEMGSSGSTEEQWVRNCSVEFAVAGDKEARQKAKDILAEDKHRRLRQLVQVVVPEQVRVVKMSAE